MPVVIKRSLTSLQITQFLVGASYAMAHSFVYYYIPVALDATTYAPRAVSCVTTSGATFAIWLNVLYLAPLTYLFASFFVASYIKRSSAQKKRQAVEDLASAGLLAEKAGWDAAKKVEKEVYGQGGEVATEGREDARLAVNGQAGRRRAV